MVLLNGIFQDATLDNFPECQQFYSQVYCSSQTGNQANAVLSVDQRDYNHWVSCSSRIESELSSPNFFTEEKLRSPRELCRDIYNKNPDTFECYTAADCGDLKAPSSISSVLVTSPVRNYATPSAASPSALGSPSEVGDNEEKYKRYEKGEDSNGQTGSASHGHDGEDESACHTHGDGDGEGVNYKRYLKGEDSNGQTGRASHSHGEENYKRYEKGEDSNGQTGRACHSDGEKYKRYEKGEDGGSSCSAHSASASGSKSSMTPGAASSGGSVASAAHSAASHAAGALSSGAAKGSAAASSSAKSTGSLSRGTKAQQITAVLMLTALAAALF